jgi:hypothetical protein
MDDFRTVIQLKSTGENSYTGKILMWDGAQQIQEDEIFKIVIKDKELSFYIMAKETHFEGEFNEGFTELSGHFVFPDGSLHSLKTVKLNPEKKMQPG